MDALPSLTSDPDNDILCPAIMALAASITTHKSGARPTKASYLGAYGTALRKLQFALKNAKQGNRFMILATVICLYTAAVRHSGVTLVSSLNPWLTISQLMLPIEENTLGRQSHHKGVQHLFQDIGPEGFIAVDSHKLFAGFRGSIVSGKSRSCTLTSFD